MQLPILCLQVSSPVNHTSSTLTRTSVCMWWL